METPYTDSMVIMAVINDYKVERVLIDDDSSVNLLPYYVLKKIGIREDFISPVSSHLQGIVEY